MQTPDKVFHNETTGTTPRLLVIADDMTGALDTSVQFSMNGAKVSMISPDRLSVPEDANVLVADAETRHLAPEKACLITEQLVRWGDREGIPHFYIKTDSGLRGNIGPALKGAMNALDAEMAAFAPAYPKMKRVTRNGCQYVDGVPIAESVFGFDPVNPVRFSDVSRLIEWDGLRIRSLRREDPVIRPESPTVYLFDAETEHDLVRIRNQLKLCEGLRLTAGCAAFAKALIPAFGLPEKEINPPVITSPLLVMCGSLNPITRNQIRFAAERGAWHRTLRSASLFSARWMEEFAPLFRQIREQMRLGSEILLDTDGETVGKDPVETSKLIAQKMGSLVKHLLSFEEIARYTPMIIGGDTLMGFLSQVNVQNLEIEGEAAPGVVVFQVRCGDVPVRMMSKSGGFGPETLLDDVVSRDMFSAERG